MKFVIDTSILIDSLRGSTKWEEFLKDQEEEVELYIPTIVIFELFSGRSTRNVKARQKVGDIIKYFLRIELTEKIAITAGKIFRDHKQTLQTPDYIIAATALELNAEVLTLNIKHFRQIPGLKLYQSI